MCGLAGVVGRPPGGGNGAAVAGMLAALAHRGPDDEGSWIEADVAFGHRRLSLVDLTPSGRQPMHSADGRFVLVLNGEIYNHRALRAELGAPALGDWRGSSDVEVLLEAIARWGLEAALSRALGMFALALWDRRERTLFLARDRFGEKPLYYAASASGVAFASELTALRRGTDCGEADPAAIAAFLRLGYVPAPLAALSGARKLPPAGLLAWTEGRAPRLSRWWTLAELADAGRAARIDEPAAAVEALDRALREVIGEQMTADAPVGVFLSGGVDSSLTAAMMQSLAGKPIRAFTMGFNSPAFDEAPAARAVAAHLGLDHTVHSVSQDDALAIIPRLAEVWDEPFADPSQIPTLLMTALARGSVKACLTGDGGDEMFAGYVRYEGAPRLWRVLRPWPRPARAAAGWLLERTPLDLLDLGFAALRPLAARYASRGRIGPDARRLGRWLGAASESDLYDLTLAAWPAPERMIGQRSPRPGREPPPEALDPLERLQWRDIHDYLPGDILAKVDRAAMHHGLETRAPLLDERIAAVAWRLEPALKQRQGQGKWILRQVLRRYLPDELIDRPKLGFTPPLHAWLTGPLRDWADGLIGAAALREAPFLDARAVTRTWRAFLAGDSSLTQRVWTVLMLQAWRARLN